ncbi:MAG TPA: hypothetical protein VH084_25570 [Mycobacterium sp.]|jgi:hypothetical protein|nr:hypothetical protein [Mycobacterium sp.]
MAQSDRLITRIRFDHCRIYADQELGAAFLFGVGAIEGIGYEPFHGELPAAGG